MTRIAFFANTLFQAHNMEVPKAILENLNVIEEQALQLFISTQCGLSHARYSPVLKCKYILKTV